MLRAWCNGFFVGPEGGRKHIVTFTDRLLKQECSEANCRSHQGYAPDITGETPGLSVRHNGGLSLVVLNVAQVDECKVVCLSTLARR